MYSKSHVLQERGQHPYFKVGGPFTEVNYPTVLLVGQWAVPEEKW